MRIVSFIAALQLLFIPAIMNAQTTGQPMKKESRERIEAQRVAFITQKLSLSPEEAAKFWPVYNQHKDALKDMRDDMERPDLMSITDDQATVIMERHLQMEEDKLELKKKLYSKLRNVIGPRKILMLHAAEKEFNRQMLRRVQDHKPAIRREKSN